MPRKSRRKSEEPVTLSDTLEEVIARNGIVPASEALRPLDPPEPPEAPEPSHAERVSKPRFQPVPSGFIPVDSYPTVGIRVNKSLDRSVAAIQFSHDNAPSRAEKDILEDLHFEGVPFAYNTGRQQWERTDYDQPGANILDAKRVGAQLAEARQEGRGR